MVDERVVLRGVEDLKQRGRRVAAGVAHHLVHFVEHQQRVPRLAPLERVDDAAREGSDVGPPVAAHFGLVAHAAQGDPRKAPPERFRDALAQRRLAHPRGPDEAQHAPLRLGVEGAHGEVLEDPFLDELEVVVVAIEDLAGGFQVEPVLRHTTPWKRSEHIEVGPGHLVLRRLRRHLAEPLELAVGHLARLGGEPDLVEPAPQVLELVIPFLFAQLLADHPQLLPQDVLALVGVEARLHLLLDLAPHLEHLQLLAEQLGEPLEPRVQLVEGEELGLGGEREIEVRGNEVRELARPVDAGQHLVQFFAEVGGDVDHAGELGVHGALQRLGARVLEQRLGKHFVARDEPVLAGSELEQPGALQPLHHDTGGAVAELQHADQDPERAHLVQLVAARAHHGALGRLRAALRLHDAEQQTLVPLHDLVDELHGLRIAERER